VNLSFVVLRVPEQGEERNRMGRDTDALGNRKQAQKEKGGGSSKRRLGDS